ncbi:hypothetical protein J2127_001405 [Methanococcus voltae]|uniref:class III signal peptide-containing protein n=1 Tax=Methanococcus voltae TaxID=2188 RepID=UPI001AE9A250|nr:class III signal peptide-containing protein [Methanococcus voltae]MBP2144235.1 hypothetical protein [Methanococcus voltae]
MLQGDTLRRGQISLEMIIITLVVLGSVSILGYTYINGVEETSAILANTSVISGYSVGGPSNSSNIDTGDPNETDDNDEDSDLDPKEKYEGQIRIKNCLIYSPLSSNSNFQATDTYGVIYTIQDGDLIASDGSSIRYFGNHYILYDIKKISLDPLYNKNYQIAINNKKLKDYQERSFEATTYSEDGILHIKVFNNGDIILYTLPHDYDGILEFQE